MSITSVVAGEGINVDNTTPTAPIVSTDGVMVVENLKSSYQTDMIDYITATNKFVFIGDSITYGIYIDDAGKVGPAPWRWATLLSQYYNKEEINLALPGYRYPDQLTVLYNKWNIESKPACPYFIACGVNDINNVSVYNQDAIITNAIATIMYATLPSSCFKNLIIGSSDIIELKGVWRKNKLFDNFGLTLLSTGKGSSGSLQVNVTGRYIIINCSCLFEDLNSWIVKIDGKKVDIILESKRVSGAIYPIDFKCWVYDTESAPGASHNVVIEAIIAPYSTICVDLIGGFDESQINSNPVFVAPIYNIASIVSSLNNAAYPYRMAYNEGIKITCRMLRNVYKLPVYYMEDTTNSYNMYGNVTSIDLRSNFPMDGIHPGELGNKWIKNRIVNFLENGEYVYRNTM